MNTLKKASLAIVLALGAAPAMAHGVHASGFMAGVAHPFSGADHLLAMLGVGMLSRQHRQGGAFLPLFVAMMAAGALARFDLPGLEFGLAASVALAGAMLLAAQRLPAMLGAALVALFALMHGQAHARELSGAASTAGFLLGSAALLAGGCLLGGQRLRAAAGAALGAAGLWLMAGAAGLA